jgi:hypothetical protein
MARVSFRTRRDTLAGGDPIGVGSYARGGSNFQEIAGVSSALQDNDKSLRSNDLLIAFDAQQESLFEATAVDYNTVLVSWELTESPTTEALLSGSSGLIGLMLRYSNLGYPESANAGDEVFYDENPVDEDLSNFKVFHENVPEGQWAYYTLFGRYYQDGGGYWYEKFASVETLVPTDYGSTDTLWKRIPQYYREQDGGDLYKFLSVFGFELDRTRTLIQSVFLGHDPLLAEAEGVDQLAKLVGLEVGVDDIGVTRTRALLHDIGFLRKRKGTIDGIIGYLTALSGARVTFEDVSGIGYQATIHAQRANLIGNPHLFGTSGSTWDTFSDQTITKVNSSGKLVMSFSGTGTATVALISKVGIPAESGTDYYMSSEITATGSTTYYGGGLLSSSTMTTLPTLTVATPIKYVGTRPVWEITTPTTTGTYYPVLYFSIPTGKSVTVDDWMLEPNNYGEYFDGSSDFGGFLYQNNFNDHAWSGTKNASYSVFTVQKKKTQEAIKRICSSIMPVTITFDPDDTDQLRLDWVPGKT